MRFIRGHALIHLLSPVDTSSDSLNIYIALFSAAFLGVGRQCILYSHTFTPAFWCVWHLPIIFVFCFTRCVIQHFVILEKPWGLCSVLEGSSLNLCVCPMFSRVGSEDVSELVYEFHARCPEGSILILSKLLSLIFGSSRSFKRAVLVVVLWVFSFLFLCVIGDLIFLDGLLPSCNWCTCNSSPCILVLLLCDKEGISGIYSLLSGSIFLVAIFPLNYSEEEIIICRK